MCHVHALACGCPAAWDPGDGRVTGHGSRSHTLRAGAFRISEEAASRLRVPYCHPSHFPSTTGVGVGRPPACSETHLSSETDSNDHHTPPPNVFTQAHACTLAPGRGLLESSLRVERLSPERHTAPSARPQTSLGQPQHGWPPPQASFEPRRGSKRPWEPLDSKGTLSISFTDWGSD